MKAYSDRIVKTSDGVALHVTSYGSGGPALVCSNGVGVPTVYWKYFVRYFSTTHQVVTWDYRGHGRSSVPPKLDRAHFTMATNARDLAAILDELGLNKVVLLGHSMGSQVIFEFWRLFPERVLALIPVCGHYGHPLETLFHAPNASTTIFQACYALATSFPELYQRVTAPFLRTQLPFWLGRLGIVNWQHCRYQDIRPYFDHLADMDPRVFFLMAGEMHRHTAKRWLGKINVPTLVIGGEDDLFSPLHLSIEMRDLIPGAELTILPRGSHVGLIEHPELMNLRIEKFLREKLSSEGGSVKTRQVRRPSSTKRRRTTGRS